MSTAFLSPGVGASQVGVAGIAPLASKPALVAPQAAATNAEAQEAGWKNQAALAACLGSFVLGLSSHGSRSLKSRRATAVRASNGGVAVVPQADKQATKPIAPEDLDDVEQSVASFVPKISALQSQAELLRSGELAEVIATMKTLRKNELRGVFSEVDQLLAALIDAIQGLRESAVSIRKSELRQTVEKLDRDAKEWVSAVEKDAVRTINGLTTDVETMMEVHVVGLSHHKASVDIREKLAVPEAQWNKVAKELVEFARTKGGYLVPEVSVLSTCNRFEIYFATPELKKFPAIEAVHAFLRQRSGLSREELDPVLFTYSGEDACRHLFEVSSGLDSLVLGEAQILAQVKACHEHAIEKDDPKAEILAGSGGKIVAKMLNAGIRMGKVVRTRTKIGKGSVSVSSAAVELMIQKSLNDLKKYPAKVKVAVIGAGKMGRLLLLALFSKHPDIDVTLVNRSVEKAQAVLDDEMVKGRGGSNAKVAGGDKMWDVIYDSDVVFAATGSEVPIMYAKDFEHVQKPMMLVDISVPRNIAKDCDNLPNATSYSVDDLKKVQQANAAKRQGEVLKAKKLIDAEVQKFLLWKASQGAVPYLAALQNMAENIRKAETEKMSLKLKGLHEKEREAVDKLTRHIIDQLFRPIYYSMKADEEVASKKTKIAALKDIFNLEPVYKRRLLPTGAGAAGQLNA